MHSQLTRVKGLIAGCVLASSAVYAQDAALLLQRMQTALGGPRLFQVRDIDWEARAKVWDGAGREAGFAVRRERVIFPYQFRKDQDMHVSNDQILHTRFYFDGKSGWGSFADMARSKNTPVAALEGPELSMVRKEVRSFWLNLWRAQDYDVSASGPHTLRFVDRRDPANIREIALDPDTWLPRDGITEWMEVEGVKFPKRILKYRAGQLVANIETITVKVNTGMKAGDLARPPAP